MRFRVLAAIAAFFIASCIPAKSLALRVTDPALKLDIHTDKVAMISGSINDATALSFLGTIAVAGTAPGDLLILIKSQGGEEPAGREIIKLIEDQKAHGIRVVCIAKRIASSMAFNILTHCDQRYAFPKTHMLMHKIANSKVPCSLEMRCTAAYHRQQAKELDELDEPYRQANAKALGLSLKDYDLLADHDHVWSLEVLLARGYLHGIITLQK